jgi:HAMP domain-containing protein
MRSSRILRTASFKLAAAYAIMFSASVAVLAAMVYFMAIAALDHQERTRLQAESQALSTEYRRGGLGKMMDEIHARARAHLVGGFDYTVVEPSGARLFGNIPPRKLESGWSRVKGPPDGDEPPMQRERLLVYSTRLAPGLWLEVGDDVGREEVFGRAIMATFGWFLLVVVSLAITGGIIISASVLARIDTITRTAEAIIEGDIDRRVPMRGVADDIDRLAGTLNRMLDRISVLLGALHRRWDDCVRVWRMPEAKPDVHPITSARSIMPLLKPTESLLHSPRFFALRKSSPVRVARGFSPWI